MLGNEWHSSGDRGKPAIAWAVAPAAASGGSLARSFAESAANGRGGGLLVACHRANAQQTRAGSSEWLA